MSDYITGGSSNNPSIDIGVGLNLNLDQSVQDVSVLASQLKEIRQDQEAFSQLLGDSSDKIRSLASGYQSVLDVQRSMLEAERDLRSVRMSSLENIQDQTAAYERMAQAVRGVHDVVSRTTGGGPGQGGTSMYGGGYQGYGTPYGYPMGGFSMLPGMMGYNQGMVNSPYGFPSYGGGGYQGGGNYQGGGYSSNPQDVMLKADRVIVTGPTQSPGSRTAPPETPTELADKLGSGEAPSGGSPTPGSPSSSIIPDSLRNTLQRYSNQVPGMAGRVLRQVTGQQGGMINDLLKKAGGGDAIAGLAGLAEGGLVAGAGIYAGRKAYELGSDVAQQGQQYSSLTGGTSAAGALNYDTQAYLESFLNPLMPYGVAKQIIQTGLGAGYRGNLLNSYTGFADQAYSQYGVSPNNSNQMFQAGVIQAGASANSLSAALAGLAETASTTDTSFAALQASFTTGLQNLANQGAGAEAVPLAAGQAQAFRGDQLLKGVSFGSIGSGGYGPQAELARALGTTITDLPGVVQELTKKGNTAGALRYAKAQEEVVRSAVGKIYSTKGTAAEQIDEAGIIQRSGILSTLVSPQVAAELGTNDKAIRDFLNKTLSGKAYENVKTSKSTKDQDLTGKGTPWWESLISPLGSHLFHAIGGDIVTHRTTTEPFNPKYKPKTSSTGFGDVEDFMNEVVRGTIRDPRLPVDSPLTGLPNGRRGKGDTYTIELGPHAKKVFELYGPDGKEIGAYNSINALNAAIGQGASNTQKTHMGSK